jgi:bacterioferritin
MFEQTVGVENFFLRDVMTLAEQGQSMLEAAPDRQARALAVDLLQTLLAAEIVCVLRYTMISVSQDALRNDGLGTEFQAQANDERRHMMMIAKRIRELGGAPNFSPAGPVSGVAAFGGSAGSFAVRVEQNLVAERCLIAHYRKLITFFARHDPETASILQEILQDEEDHSSDMQDLLIVYTQ